MKNTIFIVVILSVGFISCKSNKPLPSEKQEVMQTVRTSVNFKILSNYFVKNTFTTQKEINLLMLDNLEKFNSVFGIAKTMTNQIESPDFDNTLLLSIILKPTDKKTNLSIVQISKEGTTLCVDAKVNSGEKQSYTSVPSIIFSVKKDMNIQEIQLYVDDKKVDSLHLK